MKITYQSVLSVAAGCLVCACAGGKSNPPPPGPALPPQTPQGKFDPGPAGTPADVQKAQQEAMAMALNRTVKKEEFSLTLVADDASVAQIESINIDVISTDAGNAARLKADGPVKYRESRITGAAARSHTFKKGGRFEVKVPSIPAADNIVLWAELAAPAQGSDSRMLVIPLVLDKSDPAKGPVANPITVKLTANGWVRES
ncbi:MAG: hypothetical protein J0M04_15730 [Verrucomicrobia bacterium]|nr:hypothetical protein [Verrucomicrobiota bacterium]